MTNVSVVGPARGKLRFGDIITMVNGRDVSAIKHTELVQSIKATTDTLILRTRKQTSAVPLDASVTSQIETFTQQAEGKTHTESANINAAPPASTQAETEATEPTPEVRANATSNDSKDITVVVERDTLTTSLGFAIGSKGTINAE